MAYEYTTLNNLSKASTNTEPLPSPECYIYLHHVNTMIILPSYTDANNDSISVSFAQSTPLGRTAPIYSYQKSGPRTLLVSFSLHRDMMQDINYVASNYSSLIQNSSKTLTNVNTGLNILYIDYVDLMAKLIQAAALPTYSESSKMINPPMVSLKLGNDIFIKGVVTGSVGVSYGLPILANGYYAKVNILFSISEVAPYEATQVMKYGSYRGIDTTLGSKGVYTSNAKLVR